MASYVVRPPLARSKGKQKNAFLRFLMSVFPVKGDQAPEIIRKVVFIGAVIAFIITGGSLLSDMFDMVTHEYITGGQIKQDLLSGAGSLSAEEMEQIYSVKPYIRTELMGLFAKNNDLVGWVNIGGNDPIVDEPVVLSYDNDKYLVTDFYGNYSRSGTIFADYRTRFGDDGSAPNFMVMYGHNTALHNMFSKITWYYYDRDGTGLGSDYSMSYYLKYPTMYFDTLAEQGNYKIFAVCLFNTESRFGEVYDYLRDGKPFTSESDFNNYILNIMDRSVLFTDVDLTYGDEIICLSTCYFPFGMDYENVRCGVFARKVRDGESTEVDTSAASRNWAWKGWEQAIERGIASEYAYRAWDYKKYLLSY